MAELDSGSDHLDDPVRTVLALALSRPTSGAAHHGTGNGEHR